METGQEARDFHDLLYNGNIRQTTIANGLSIGPSKEYRISGELMVEEAYLQDNLHGAKIEFLQTETKSWN